jgi:hypothetical protein
MAMAELLSSIEAGREPKNSAEQSGDLELCFAAVAARSAVQEQRGAKPLQAGQYCGHCDDRGNRDWRARHESRSLIRNAGLIALAASIDHSLGDLMAGRLDRHEIAGSLGDLGLSCATG